MGIRGLSKHPCRTPALIGKTVLLGSSSTSRMRQEQAATAEVVVVGEVCCDVGRARAQERGTLGANAEKQQAGVRVVGSFGGGGAKQRRRSRWEFPDSDSMENFWYAHPDIFPSSWMCGGEMPAMKILPPMFTIFMLPIEGFRKAFLSSTHPCRTPMLVLLPM